MYETYHSGWIECITGSMFSGKSEELIRRLRRGLYAKQKVVVFKPAIDDRYHKDKIVSHNGNAIEAFNISTASEILRHDLTDVGIIGIDEVQFFEDEVVKIAEHLASQGHRVITAGLDYYLLAKSLLNCKLYVQFVAHHQAVHNDLLTVIQLKLMIRLFW
jgi:thymidine kinase